MREHIVFEPLDEGGDRPENLENVEEVLVDGLTGEVDILQLQPKQIVTHSADLLVGLHVVHIDNVDVVECFVEALRDFSFNVDDAVEDTQFFEVHQLQQVLRLRFERVLSFDLLDEHEVDVDAQEVFDLSLQGKHIAALELVQDELFVVEVHLPGFRQVGALLQHFTAVLEAVEQELQTLTGIGVVAFILEEAAEDILAAVQEAAISELLQSHSPVVHQFKAFDSSKNFRVFAILQETLIDEAQRVANYR